MKRSYVGCLAAALLIALPALVHGQISGSGHDFSGDAWNTSGQICIVCHTPHNSDITVTNAPLWNHEVSTATYTPYAGSGTLDATVGQPTGISLLCLSCHDGTVALDSYGGATGTTFLTGSALVGTDLSNDHPVGFTYDAALASLDGELEDPANIAPLPLFTGSLECATCHDAHDDTNSPFLRIANTASAMCLTCHLK